jgi:ferrous iron transport protein B
MSPQTGDMHAARPAAPGGAKREVVVALAGNPNAGKTTLFNALTGSRHHVGNYPGVTVEKREGYFRHAGRQVRVVDLPGTYSLTARSLDERVARRFVLDEKPDVVVSVVDASNLERNLYLAVQFMELNVPLVLAFNKSDLARQRGMDVDTERLEPLLGLRIVSTVASRGTGLDPLKDAMLAAADDHRRPAVVRYGPEIEAELEQLEPLLAATPLRGARHHARWLALKLLEQDREITECLREEGEAAAALETAAARARERLERHFGDRIAMIVADRRYGVISGACQECVRVTAEQRHSISDRVDEVLTGPVVGIPIFLFVMYLLFRVTFSVSAAPMAWIEAGFNALARQILAVWPSGTLAPLRSLVVDGVLGGAGGVLVFLPPILVLYAVIAFLEDSGYMARAAFITDRFMHRIGLHGKSFIPMILGFGCSVPAILSTRTLESRRDRMTTMLVLPLVSCGARLPIYTLLTAAFFPPAWRPRILMLMYLTGIALAALLAKLLRSTVFRGETSAFVLELPPYRLPTLNGIARHTWERGRLFVRKAGTVIVAASIVLWAATNYPRPPAQRLQGLAPADRAAAVLGASVAGRVGRGLEPVMRHVGFDWKTTTALFGAMAAKEIFVAQLGIIYAVSDVDHASVSLQEALRREYTPLQAYCIMLFCLVSVPCVATLAVTRQESGRWRWALLQFVGLTLLAYVLTLAVYQGGRLAGRLLL